MKRLTLFTALFLFAMFMGACLQFNWTKRNFKSSEFERGAMFIVEYYKLNQSYPSYGVREMVFANDTLDASFFDLSVEQGRINAGLDTASARRIEEDVKQWKRETRDRFYKEHNIDSTELSRYVVTFKDKEGRINTILGVPDLNPDKPVLDSTQIEISSIIIEL